MHRLLVWAGLVTLALVLAVVRPVAGLTVVQNAERIRARATRLHGQGNFAEALPLFRKLSEDEKNSDKAAAQDLRNAVRCLQQLSRLNEVDELLQNCIDAHSADWRVLVAAAQLLQDDIDDYGFLIGGVFERGHHRGGGKQVSATQRDRVRALQLLLQALPLLQQDRTPAPAERAAVFYQLARTIGDRARGEAWRLQQLTDLELLPDYEDVTFAWRGHFGSPQPGTPVDEDGEPVLYVLPDSWEAARSDGERWRWALRQSVVADEGRLSSVDLQWAQFLHGQFGVQPDSLPALVMTDAGDGDTAEEMSWQLHTLLDSDMISRLATGKRRITLPDEFNHIAILKRIVVRADSSQRAALGLLTRIRMNRHQYAKAAELLEQSLKLRNNQSQRRQLRSQLRQIRNNWIQFESCNTQAAGAGAVLAIRYRNGTHVSFTARRIDIEQLLTDTRRYLEGRPGQLDYNQLQIENIGHRLIRDNRNKYLGAVVATWELDLNPPENYFDAQKSVTTPVQDAGAYWVEAEIDDGNTSRIVLWIADMAITRKRVEGGTMSFVADAATGKPIRRADLEFFGFRQERIERTRNYRVLTSRFAERTNDDGLIIVTNERRPGHMQWLTIARTAGGRLAFHGFRNLWNPERIPPFSYSPVKVYAVTDRPVYRPGHSMKFRLWARQPRFHEEDTRYSHQNYILQVRNPRGDIVEERRVTTDRWAGVDGEWTITEDAVLGQYSLALCRDVDAENKPILGSATFRVEEYRKPEFEVTIEAPDKPVTLGETIPATIQAKYYFGAPVTEGTVRYKVERTKKDSRWFPVGRWDWLYSPGYWWFAPDHTWYPGWERWGCFGPIPPWFNWNPDPPELVAEGKSSLTHDGVLKIDIDTANALREHGDSDHSYKITAEVIDQSRRTIFATGEVIVAREPFKVFVSTDRGHYQTGDTAEVHLQARTPDGRGVKGFGKAVLYSVSWNGEKPVETEVESFEIETDNDGATSVKMVIPTSGQFRVSCTITDADGHTMEGATVLYVRGPDRDGRGYRFNDLELITDRREYEPGDTVSLQINTNLADSTVLLFIRPVNGLCPQPEILRLKGKSTALDLNIQREDMPNIFIEALTIVDGRVHTAVREIFVPPKQKVASVEIRPSKNEYRPGENATVKFKLTDEDGRPFVGNIVLSAFDASLEYIAASSIPEIRSFFWNVRRHHHIYVESTLQRITSPLFRRGEEPMMRFGEGREVAPAALQMKRRRGVAAAAPAGLGISEQAEAMDAVEEDSLLPPVHYPEDGDAGALADPAVRSEFADTALWLASVDSDADGLVTAAFKVPDNLTTWRIHAWTLGDGTRVGSGTTDVICSKDLIVRPQTPRFFTEKDQITLSAVVHNYLDSSKDVQTILETEGGQLQLLDPERQTVCVEANGEVRVDWTVQVVASGQAIVRMKALTDEESDAAQLTVPAHVHGLLKTDSFSGVIRPDEQTATIELRVPAERIEEQSRLEVRYSPSLAGALLDALPYLIEYPYGCTEQTLNRFLPAVLTQKTLLKMGIDLEDVRKKRTNLNAQQTGDPPDRAAAWNRRSINPIFDTEEMNTIVADGVQSLIDMQLTDGGWGWFSGYGERSTPHLTAIVVHGLTVAQLNDVPVLPDVIQRGVTWLKNYQKSELKKLRAGDRRREAGDGNRKRRKPFKIHADNLDALVAWVLSEHAGSDPEMTNYLYSDRLKLSVYGMSLTGLVLSVAQDTDRHEMVLRNIEQYLEQDNENQTAWLRMPGNDWCYWYGGENEAHAMYLRLLLQVRPNDELASRLVKYLLNNRRAAGHWDSTRDTALVIESIAEYIRVTGEDQPDMTVEVRVDGQVQKCVRITSENLFSFDNVMLLEGDAVRTGKRRVDLRRTGKGPVYFNAYLTNFTREDPIAEAGLELRVDRRFYRLERDDRDIGVRGSRAQVVDQQSVGWKRIPLEDLDQVASGDLVEVEILVESKNDYEYLMLEDRKPSGFEPDDQRSGYVFEGLRAYRELRDDRVTFFLSDLARGRHSIRYRLRAEIPGRMAALPTKIEGMYAPELIGNSREFKLQVVEER